MGNDVTIYGSYVYYRGSLWRLVEYCSVEPEFMGIRWGSGGRLVLLESVSSDMGAVCSRVWADVLNVSSGDCVDVRLCLAIYLLPIIGFVWMYSEHNDFALMCSHITVVRMMLFAVFNGWFLIVLLFCIICACAGFN